MATLSSASAQHGRLPPQRQLLVIVVFIAAACALSIFCVLQTPWLGIHFEPASDGGGLRVASVMTPAAGTTHLKAGDRVVGLIDGAGHTYPLTPRTIIEEPDVLPSYAAINAFLVQQSKLALALETAPLSLLMPDGTRVPVTATARPLRSLPLYFWWQIIIGSACLLIGASIWAYRPRQTAARLLVVSSIGAFGFMTLAAIYSNRELAMNGDLFRWVMAATHLFTLLHTAALLALIWVYPRRLGAVPVPGLCFIGAACAWLLDTSQLTPSPLWSHYLFINVAFVIGLFFVYGQWRATRDNPVERAVMRWFVLAIFSASLTNILFLKAPLLFGARPTVDQGWVFVAQLLMYVGLALGIIRYRLFDLERWWFKIWLWFFAGLGVIALDLALLLGLKLGVPEALGLSLAVAGWLYFPIRQRIWSRMVRRRGGPLDTVLPGLISRLTQAESATAIHAAWPNILEEVFAPLSVDEGQKPTSDVQIRGNGTQLWVPGLDPAHGLVLHHAAHGTRLFGRLDVARAHMLLDVTRRIATATEAREQGMQAERERIMRDLHDDLGARLLSLVYAVNNPKAQDLANAALDDLHDVLAAARRTPEPLGRAIDRWLEEGRRRLGEAGIECHARIGPLPARLLLSARLQTNVGRIVREALSNAIRHARPGKVDIDFQVVGDVLVISLTDDGKGSDPACWGDGNGLRTMRSRAEDIDAEITWSRTPDGGCRVQLCLPLPARRGYAAPGPTTPSRTASSVASARLDTSSFS